MSIIEKLGRGFRFKWVIFLAVAVSVAMIGMAGALSVSMSSSGSGETVSQSMDFTLEKDGTLSSQAVLGSGAILSDLETTGQTDITMTSSGGNTTFGAKVIDRTGIKSTQLSTADGVVGEMSNQNGYQFFNEEEEVAISRGELGISAQALTDSGTRLYYTSLPYYTGKDYLTEYDSAKNEIVYLNVPTRSFTQNGVTKTVTEQSQFNAIAGAVNTWNAVARGDGGPNYVSNLYSTRSTKATFESGANGVNSVSWMSDASGATYNGIVGLSIAYYRPSDGYVDSFKIGLNPRSGYNIAANNWLPSLYTHEFGHAAVGLTDSYDPRSVMYFGTNGVSTSPTFYDQQLAEIKRKY